MILVDANILVYAHVSSMPRHSRAGVRLDDQLNGTAAVGLPWPALLGFIRLTTNPRVFERPLSVAGAWRQVRSRLECEPAWIPLPTERHADVLEPPPAEIADRCNLVPDADLAALAIEHGLTLCSTDGDFARFRGLRRQNPLR